MTSKQNIKNNGKGVILFICTLLFCYDLPAQSYVIDTTTATIFEGFQRDTILPLTIHTDTKQLIKKKYKEEWQAATLNFSTINNQEIEYSVKLRTRGNIRKEVCYYPPLKLKFKKKWLNENRLDSNYNDLKLVIGCKKGKTFKKLVLKEYLTYQLYAALTKYSFKTQLVSVKLVDSNKKENDIETIGFIIENQEELADRHDGRCVKPKIMRASAIDVDHWAFLSLFEFMIGNTDWAMPNSHNVRFLYTRPQGKAFPIAYDFDYSGLVNAPYAVHRESLKIEDIRTRHFLGSCRIKDQLTQQLPLFEEKKASLYKIVNDFTLLPEKDRKIIIEYLDQFYTIISNPKGFERSIVRNCIEEKY